LVVVMSTGPEQRLREAGLRVTRPRLAVLEVLDEARGSRSHLPVSAIVTGVRVRLGEGSTQAVYDCVEALGAAGLVRRVESAGSPARYETHTGDNHHHLVCRGCGHAVDVDCVVGAAPCLQPSATHGFVLDEAEVFFWGLCPDCTTTGATAGAHHPLHAAERGRA
jgi:Fur family transcriptional regulator, stress-responsive regulator